jgi:hypothetical protein
MSKRLNYTKKHLLGKLHDELLGAGIVPELVEDSGDNIWLTVSDSQPKAAVDAVVSAHSDAPPPPRSGSQLVEDLRQALLVWETLTPLTLVGTQRDAVLRRCARAIVAIAEMVESRSA